MIAILNTHALVPMLVQEQLEPVFQQLDNLALRAVTVLRGDAFLEAARLRAALRRRARVATASIPPQVPATAIRNQPISNPVPAQYNAHPAYAVLSRRPVFLGQAAVCVVCRVTANLV